MESGGRPSYQANHIPSSPPISRGIEAASAIYSKSEWAALDGSWPWIAEATSEDEGLEEASILDKVGYGYRKYRCTTADPVL